MARQQNLTTAAAAYHWFSELYNRSPYVAIRDRHTEEPEQAIQYGCFYHEDHYPDSHLFLDAENLRRRYHPDFLLVHPMNIDAAGHKAGLDSSHYRNTVRSCDIALSDYLPIWLAEGYQILVTSDHGMNVDNSHGGILPEEREVPLFVMGESFSHDDNAIPKQTDICGTVCSILGLQNHGKTVCTALLKNQLDK